MFEHHTQEILELLRSVDTKLDVIHHDQLHIRDLQMATLQQIKDAQATETQAIQDFAARVANLPHPAATEADLDPILATAQANTAALAEIAPAPAA